MNAAELIVKTLERAGVKYMFGIPGGAIEGLNNALYANKNIKVIVTKNEAGAAYMADGYARFSGNLGVCFSTAGPGASNLVTGLANAYIDGIPVCALTGQVPTSLSGKGAFQESGQEGVNIVAIFRKFTRFSGTLSNELRTEYMIRQCLRTARSTPSGPVHMSLPVDILKREVFETMPPMVMVGERVFDRESVEKAALILSTAQNPAIIAGWGVVLSRGSDELLKLSQLLNIPVATSPKAKGVFPESHPLSLGVLGFAGSPVAKEYILEREVDVLVAIGTSFDEMTTSGWDERLFPAKHLIHIDANPEKIGRNYHTSVGVVGDAKTVIRELNLAIKRQCGAGADETFLRGVFNRPELDRIKAAHGSLPEPESTGQLYHPYELIKDIQKSFPQNTAYFVEIGAVMAWALRYMIIERPCSFFLPIGFGGMGYSTAACVGAKLAAGDRPVAALCGDGGFLMSGLEVATAVNHDIPAIWVIFNNAMHGMIYHGRRSFDPPVSEGIPTRFKRVDFAKLGEGLGARGVRIEKPGGLTPELVQDIIAEKRPAVLDILIDEEAAPPFGTRIKTMDKHFG